MKARVEYEWATTMVNVWLYEEAFGAVPVRVLQCKGADEWSEVQVPVGAMMPAPTLVLSSAALEALVDAARDHLPPSAATDRHLNDAIKVRDSLLAMVEVAFRPVVRAPGDSAA